MSHQSPPAIAHKCPTVFVPDLPALNDAFATNKAYKRIVSAIVEVVTSRNNDGMSIGVEGSWGAGKTTIINLLRDELRNSSATDQICLIAFDAWAHEGDPLRLTFLETLKDELVTKGWLNENTWKERLDIISGRKEIRDTASDFGLTGFDYVIAVSFFLIPVGVAFVQAALRNGLTFDSSQPVDWEFLVGLFLCVLAPLLVLAKLRWEIWQNKRTKSRATSSESKLQKTRQTILALLLNRTLSAGRTVVVKTPEPTSTEFEKEFKNLMNDALYGYKERRIILVLDNLDRVQRPQAVAIWSTLQTFLQHRHHNPPESLKQLYTIVLYDPKRIAEQPSNPDIKTSGAIDNFSDISPSFHPKPEQAEDSFLDKTFQIRFEVPPPILSDWRGYLLELLKKALPKHDTAEYHDIYRVLAVERHSHPPTIRELKVYVNQISAIHLQWEDSFPLSHVAYYVRLKRRKEEVVPGLIRGNFPEIAYSGILGENVRDSLASLSFNVERKIAYQLLLGDPIREALGDSTGNQLKDLKGKFDNGFWEALETVVSSDWMGGQSEKVGIGILAMEHSGVLVNSERVEAGSVRNALTNNALALKAWKPFNAAMAVAISVVCQWSSHSSSSDDLVKLRSKRLLEAIAEGLFDRNPMRKDPVDVPKWLNALHILMERNNSLGLPDMDYVDIVVSQIRDRLKNSDYVEPEEISRLLEALTELSFREPVAIETLQALVDGKQILHYFNYVHAGKSAHASCAWCIWVFSNFGPNVESPSTHGYTAFVEILKNSEVQDLQEFSKLLVRYKDILTSSILKRGGVLEDFLYDCLKHIASGPAAESFFTPQFILRNWAVLSSKISDWKKDVPEFNSLLVRLANDSELTTEIHRRGFKADEADLYSLLIENGESKSSAFGNWCRAILEELTAAEWELDMENRLDLVHLASILRKTGSSLKLGEQYNSAVVATVEHVINDPDVDSFLLLFDKSFLLDPLEDSDRQSVCDRIYEIVKSANGELPYGFFPSFGKFISKVLRLDQGSVTSILRPMLEKRDESALKWLTRVVRENGSSLENQSDPQAVNDFKKIVQTALAKPSDSATPLIDDLASLIGVKHKTE